MYIDMYQDEESKEYNDEENSNQNFTTLSLDYRFIRSITTYPCIWIVYPYIRTPSQKNGHRTAEQNCSTFRTFPIFHHSRSCRKFSFF